MHTWMPVHPGAAGNHACMSHRKLSSHGTPAAAGEESQPPDGCRSVPIASIQHVPTPPQLQTIGLLIATFAYLYAAAPANAASRRLFAVTFVAVGALATVGIFHMPIENSARLTDLPFSTATASGQGSGGGRTGGGAPQKGGRGNGGGAAVASVDAVDAGGTRGGGAGGPGRSSRRVTLAALVAGKSESSPGSAFRDCPTCPEMAPLPSGYGQFGADAADLMADASEKPQRIVTHFKPFAIGRREITVAEFAAFAEATRRPGPRCGERSAEAQQRAVECVSFYDARAYVAWLSHKTGRNYRLPSASEWEYAARGGRDLPFAAGAKPEDRNANIGLNGRRNAPAGTLAANGFGLEDMTGNLAEMVADCWSATLADVPGDGQPLTSSSRCRLRTLKDAAWSEPVRQARISARRPLDPAVGRAGVGFRVVAEIR